MKQITLVLLTMLSAVHANDIKCIEPTGGASRCVIVNAAPLAHTAQISGIGATLVEQIKASLDGIDTALRSGGSSLSRAVKLNIYVTQDSTTPEVEMALSAAFPGVHKPAVSFVTTTLPNPAALIAMDAVGATAEAKDSTPSCAVLPIGPRVYISGQAEKGDGTLADATKQTMASLGRTLEFLGLEWKNVVQVKSFLTPMTEHEVAQQEITGFFKNTPVPPCVFVEWKSTLPIEIEMIVSAAGNPALAQGPSLEVRTPPGMTTPAIYSRLTITRHPAAIYTSGLYPDDPRAPAETHLRSLFTNLKQCLDLSGSDWMHLVKATYYVNNDDLSKWHNTVRSDYFSPRRPPAASKASVTGVGRAGHGIAMDFIVVPGEP